MSLVVKLRLFHAISFLLIASFNIISRMWQTDSNQLVSHSIYIISQSVTTVLVAHLNKLFAWYVCFIKQFILSFTKLMFALLCLCSVPEVRGGRGIENFMRYAARRCGNFFIKCGLRSAVVIKMQVR